MTTATLRRLDAPGDLPRHTWQLDDRIALSLLDKLHRGVIVMTAQAPPLFMNRTAHAMLLRGDAMSLATGQLTLHDRRARVRLNAFLEHTPCDDAGMPETLVLRLERMNALPPYRLLAMRMDAATLPTEGRSRVFALFIYEPHAGRFIPTRVLTDLYGLTQGEARLTASLFQGHTMTDAARSLGIALSTARTQLKQAFAKCEVHSQAELLQLLALGPRTS